MAIKLLIPTALQPFTENSEELEVEATTVDEALSALVARYPTLRKHLYGDGEKLRSFVSIFVGAEDTRYLGGVATALKPGDEVSIVPSIAGGVSAPPEQATTFTNEEIQRYSRHLIMPEVALAGQKKLKNARVLCVGAGGLGSPLAMYLAAAGVGTLGIVDFDVVDYSNLQRQIIHGTSDVGRPKLQSAIESIKEINPFVTVEGFQTALTSDNALEICRGFDIVVDGTDNFPTRYLVNDACVLLGKPNVYGSIFRFEGQASVFWAERGPCYRCLYPEPPPPGLVPSCAEGGVLGILPGMIGVLQATEAVKLVLGVGEPLIGRLLLFNALKMQWRELKLRKDPACPICGENPTVHELIDYQQFCGVVPEAPVSAEVGGATPDEISVRELKQRFDRGERPLVLDVREPYEADIAVIPYTTLIPMNEVPNRLDEIPKSAEVILQCRSGKRSMQVLEYLRSQGYSKLKNLSGGILAWSDDVDPSVAKY